VLQNAAIGPLSMQRPTICGLEAVIRHRPKKYRKGKPDYVAENVLVREFTSEKPNQKWRTDVTEFKNGNGKKLI